MAKRLTTADFAEMISFGTFKPVGYTVLTYADEATARAAIGTLEAAGFAGSDLQVASSQQIFPQVSEKMAESKGMIGAQGYEVVLMKRYLEIAARGVWWLFAWSPKDEDVARIKAVLHDPAPLIAASYGHLMIEDLTEAPTGQAAH